MKVKPLDNFSQHSSISNYMKIRRVVPERKHTDKETRPHTHVEVISTLVKRTHINV
jgi:hypothetical protein